MQSLTISQCIPISPTPEVPEWILIEINGELLPPVVMPSHDESETILELGRLYLTHEKVRRFVECQCT